MDAQLKMVTDYLFDQLKKMVDDWVSQTEQLRVVIDYLLD
jgi:hypothetical protein